MSSRKPKKRKVIRGGVGDDPAGRGGIADLLFQAREGMSPDRIRANTLASDTADLVDPTPENRAIETFQTVEDDLRQGMSQTKKDNVTRQSLQQMADSMIRVMDEANRPDLSPADRADSAAVVEAFRGAFQSLPDEQKAVLVSIADSLAGDLSLPSATMMAEPPRPRGAEMAQFFGAPQEIGEKTPTSLIADLKQRRGLAAARAMNMDARGDAATYRDATMIGGLPNTTTRPYYGTTRANNQRAIMATLIDEYGLDPMDVGDATLTDAAVPPFEPAPGVYTARDKFPAAERLSTYTGGDVADKLVKSNAINLGDIGRKSLLGKQGDVWNQYDAIVAREGDPRLAPVVGDLLGDDLIREPTDPWTKQSLADDIADRQMRTEDVRLQEYLWKQAFGEPMTGITGAMDDSGGLAFSSDPELSSRNAALFALDWAAPWHRGQVERVGPDGQIIPGKFTAEEVVDTILSQSGFMAEQPFLRAAARERLIPQVQEAMDVIGTGEGGPAYKRNAVGRAMLKAEGGVYPEPKPKPKPQIDKKAIEQLRQRLNKPMPGTNDLGFSEPMQMPAMAREMAPNRLLAALIG